MPAQVEHKAGEIKVRAANMVSSYLLNRPVYGQCTTHSFPYIQHL